MARRDANRSPTDLLMKISALTRELTEAREQQTATSQVLKVISSSPTNIQPVLDIIGERAEKLCEAEISVVSIVEGELIHMASIHGVTEAGVETFRHAFPMRLTDETVTARAIRTSSVCHVADVLSDPLHPKVAARASGLRGTLCVPMVRDGQVAGAILVARKQPGLFSDTQVQLLKTFADQAVIAIENVRLLNELRGWVEQQTAASEVLKVISSSHGKLETVFNTMLANATRLCDAKFGILYLSEQAGYRAVAMHNVPLALVEARQNKLLRFAADASVSRAATTRQPCHQLDTRAEQSYIEGDPHFVAAVTLGGMRTVVSVPILKYDQLIGVISIYRQEVRPFTDKQIAVVENFAAQAVIAIENARLLDDLNKLNQQLEQRVTDQVGEIERMSRLRRFLPPQVADLIVASGTEKQLESHRRDIAALFCDLRGFTGFSESADPEDVMALLRDYHAAIGEIVIKYGGTLERFAGDGVMVIFNDPVPVENPALQAVLMALDMRTSIGGMIEKWRDLGHDLGFGIGIAHGFATLGTIGFEGRFDYAAIGTVSNVASRLCDEAKPGQILISPRVRQAVEKAVTVESVGEFALKGIRRPMLAYNVLEHSPSKLN
jgi:class 3 adenylate cyclase/putative methionine-R-sulfoxide reductase with GAF domain